MKRINGILIIIYNFLIARKLINRKNKVCRRLRKMLFHNICYECKATFGRKNPDKVIYIIRCSNEKIGFFGLYNHVVFQLKKAEELGAYPVVDWQHYPNSGILEDCFVGKENAWEYYFEQTSKISLREAYCSKNVIMSTGEVMGSLEEVWQEEKLLHSQEIIRKYIKLSKVCQRLIENKYEELEMGHNKVCGVLCRGTDFVMAKPKGHTVCPSVEETIDKIEEMQHQWGMFDKIFLATEDENIFKRMQEYFGNRLIFCQEHRVTDSSGKWLNELYDSDDYQKVKKAMMKEYLASIYLLARCDALIAPVVGGTLGAMRIKGKYEKLFLFQLGIYG